MTQANYSIASDQTGSAYRGQDNDGKEAIASHHKGGSAPSYAIAGMTWLDDNASPWTLKIYDGSDWIPMAAVNPTTDEVTFYFGGALMQAATNAIAGLLRLATDGEANAGALENVAVNPKQLQAAVGSGFPTPGYAPANQVIVLESLITLTHGLGGVPSNVNLWIECQSADVGYAVGDRILMNGGLAHYAHRGVSVAVNATQIKIATARTAINVVNASDQTWDVIDESKWEFVVESWA